MSSSMSGKRGTGSGIPKGKRDSGASEIGITQIMSIQHGLPGRGHGDPAEDSLGDTGSHLTDGNARAFGKVTMGGASGEQVLIPFGRRDADEKAEVSHDGWADASQAMIPAEREALS